jgi:hypothetical protein
MIPELAAENPSAQIATGGQNVSVEKSQIHDLFQGEFPQAGRLIIQLVAHGEEDQSDLLLVSGTGLDFSPQTGFGEIDGLAGQPLALTVSGILNMNSNYDFNVTFFPDSKSPLPTVQIDSPTEIVTGSGSARVGVVLGAHSDSSSPVTPISTPADNVSGGDEIPSEDDEEVPLPTSLQRLPPSEEVTWNRSIRIGIPSPEPGDGTRLFDVRTCEVFVQPLDSWQPIDTSAQPARVIPEVPSDQLAKLREDSVRGEKPTDQHVLFVPEQGGKVQRGEELPARDEVEATATPPQDDPEGEIVPTEAVLLEDESALLA